MYKCINCNQSWLESKGAICPYCGSDDTVKLEQVKSSTHWPYVNRCFLGD